MATKSSAASASGVVATPSLTLKRRLHAAPAKVWAAWTDPEKIARWFGPSDTKDDLVRAELDVRVGGRFRASFNTADGEYHQVGGIYREVVPNQRLVFSWAWHSTPERESLVTVMLKPDGVGTLLTLQHDNSSTKPRPTAIATAGPARPTSWNNTSPESSSIRILRQPGSRHATAQIVSREEWTAARKAHLAHEKELTRARDRLSAERRELPWVKVEKNYVFDGPMARRRWPTCSAGAAN